VIALARHITKQLGGENAFDLSPDVEKALVAYSWPGNVRELRNAIERAIHLGAEHAIPMVSGGEKRSHAEDAPDLPFKEAKEKIISGFERAYLERLMSRHSNNISAAARDAGIDRNYLYRLLKKHDLEEP
jgi:DNA-binding NtrC family response regulator